MGRLLAFSLVKMNATMSATTTVTPDDEKDEQQPHSADEKEEASLGDLSIYKLDYETKPLAAGGEVLEAGDHVYIWCTLYQHHGIVLEASVEHGLLIAEFTNAALLTTPLMQSASHASTAISTGVGGAFRFVQETEPSKWHKVKYGANPLECWTWRPGTCCGATPDANDLVLTRVQFLYTCRHLIPDYHVLASNCEAVAMWCKTGLYTSLQVRLLEYSKATVTGLGAAVLSPVAGIAIGGLAVWHSKQVEKQCNETTIMLNREFSVYNMGKSPLTRQWIYNDKSSS